jgi:hypothetical protein
VLINYSGAYDALLFALDQRGLRLAAENGETVLRRRREGDVPVPRPVVVVPTTEAPVNPPLPPPAGLPVAPPPATVPQQPAPRPENAPTDLLPVPKT